MKGQLKVVGNTVTVVQEQELAPQTRPEVRRQRTPMMSAFAGKAPSVTETRLELLCGETSLIASG